MRRGFVTPIFIVASMVGLSFLSATTASSVSYAQKSAEVYGIEIQLDALTFDCAETVWDVDTYRYKSLVSTQNEVVVTNSSEDGSPVGVVLTFLPLEEMEITAEFKAGADDTVSITEDGLEISFILTSDAKVFDLFVHGWLEGEEGMSPIGILVKEIIPIFEEASVDVLLEEEAAEPEFTEEAPETELEFAEDAPETEPEFAEEAPETEPEFTEETPETEPEFTEEAPETEPEFTEEAPAPEEEESEETSLCLEHSEPTSEQAP